MTKILFRIHCRITAGLILLVFIVGLWGILNNAGVHGMVTPADWITLQDYRKIFDVNLFGLVDVTTTFLPLVKKEKGRIVNTCKNFTKLYIYLCANYFAKLSTNLFHDMNDIH